MSDIETRLRPFGSVNKCPKCGNSTGRSVKYSTDFKISSSNGLFVSVHTAEMSPYPHLEKHCTHCGYGWLEDVADSLNALCDCIASGNTSKPKQHLVDPHAKNCRIYGRSLL